MLTIAVVDDEERIRLGLAKLIALTGEDCHIAGVYSCGQELLEQMDDLKPDLIITDIKMPQMTGLQLMAKVKEGGWKAKFAVLSGYSDFEFVREALRQGAMEYLLKPVYRKDLQQLLGRVREQVERERGKDKLAPDKLLSFLLCSDEKKLPGQLFEDVCAKLDETPPFRGHYAALLLRCEPELPEPQLNRLLADRWGEKFVVAYDAGRQAVILPIGQSDNPNSVREKAVMLLQDLPRLTRAKIGISSIFAGSRWLPQAIQEAGKAFEHAWYNKEPRWCSSGVTAEAGQEERLRLNRMVDKQIVPALQLGDKKQAEAKLDEWLGEIAALRLDWGQLRESAFYLEALVAEELKLRSLPNPGDFGIKPEAYGDWTAFAETLRGQMLIRAHLLEASCRENRAVETVKVYIHAHYPEEMELQRLADMVYLTPSYLSKLFRTETGETITDYIIGERIRRAKELLRQPSGLKTYEVGEKVGYADPAYFTNVFKKMTGKTPKEYRDLVR